MGLSPSLHIKEIIFKIFTLSLHAPKSCKVRAKKKKQKKKTYSWTLNICLLKNPKHLLC